jgi:hypothetical protein
MSAGPREVYASRVEQRTQEAATHFNRFRRVGIIRLSFVALLILLLITWLLSLTSFWWLLLPAIGFLVLALPQQRIAEQKRRCERAVKIYQTGIARIDDEWAGKGATGDRFNSSSHPYAGDLDLFGVGSLFELLSIARTQVGEETLARWLLAPASLETIRERQLAVTELRPGLDLREDLALLGEGVPGGAEAQVLTNWATAPPWSISPRTKWLARILGAGALAGLVLWFAGFGWQIFLITVFVGQLFAFQFRRQTLKVISDVDLPGRDLRLLVDVLRRLEQERFQSPLLVRLRSQLDVAGQSPSQQIAGLRLLIDLLDSTRNMFFAPFSFILLWPLQCAIAIEEWRQRSGPAIGRWLAAVGELEALSSFAGYAFERPDDPFPDVVDSHALFDGEGLGHPLVPDAKNVRTDLYLSKEPAVLIVSGSNMSGKSTLLRTVGTNAVLALAGAPVRARSLRLSLQQIGASIRVQDSLQAGASKFYAEITCLRQIVDLTKGPLPVLFLLDEILHGTNSHDRKIGAEGVVKGLIERGAIGLVTTHDLALTQIVADLRPRAANVHFEDHLEAGKMTFDYVLRPGVLQKSNALELMRSVGLEV